MSNSKSIARAAAPRAGLPLRVRLFGGYAVLILFSLGLAGTGIWGLAAIGAQLYNLKHSSDALRHAQLLTARPQPPSVPATNLRVSAEMLVTPGTRKSQRGTS